ncbi:MAG: lipopolysaccharide biosynthesis protein, partial [Cetobacterium sp.]
GVTETFKITSGFFDDVYSPFLEGVLNLIFSLILVKTIGLNGVIIGTLISNVVVIIILKPILVFKRCFNQLILNYFKVFFKNIFLSIFSWILVEICIRILKLDLQNIINWKSWILMAFVIALLSLIFTGILFLSQKDNRKILKKIKE